MNGSQLLRLELLAIESAPHGVIDPRKDVPFAVVWETMGTLYRLADGADATESEP